MKKLVVILVRFFKKEHFTKYLIEFLVFFTALTLFLIFSTDDVASNVIGTIVGFLFSTMILYIVKIVSSNFEDILNVSIKELIIVISNCLDNAINASLKVPNNRFVSFIFLNNNDRLILQIKNKYNGKIQIDENNLPTNPSEMHGYGTRSIELFAKRNNITLDYNITKTTFEITLLFNVK